MCCLSLSYTMGGSRGGGVSGVATPQMVSHSIKCSTTDVLSHANALIYIAKCLVKPLSMQASCGVA